MKKLRMFNFFSHDWNLSVLFFCIIFWKLYNHFPTEIWNLSLKKMNAPFSFENQNSKCRKFRNLEDNPLTPIFNHSKFAIFEEKPIPITIPWRRSFCMTFCMKFWDSSLCKGSISLQIFLFKVILKFKYYNLIIW